MLKKCGTVVGVVRDAASEVPIEGAEILLPWRSLGDVSVTDALGEFRFAHFPVGNQHFTLYARAKGYGEDQVFVEMRETGNWDVVQSIYGDEDVSGAHPPATVEFYLPEHASFAGTVVDQIGRGISGATVEARGYYSIGFRASAPDIQSAVTDQGGRFHLDDLRSDIDHSISIAARGYAHATYTPPPGNDQGGPCELGALTLYPATRLHVVVRDAAGNLASGLTVKAVSSTSPQPVISSAGAPIRHHGARESDFRQSTRSVTKVTDAGGAVVFEGLGVGTHRISVGLGRSLVFGAAASKLVSLAPGPGDVVEYLSLPPDVVTLHGIIQVDSQSPMPPAVQALIDGKVVVSLPTFDERQFSLAGVPIEAEVKFTIDWFDSNGTHWTGDAMAIAARANDLIEVPVLSTPLAR